MSWQKLSEEQAKQHPLYGVKNWLAVFAFFAAIGPLLDIGHARNLATELDLPFVEMLGRDEPLFQWLRAAVFLNLSISGVMGWALVAKSRHFRVIATVLLVVAYPLVSVLALLFDVPGAGSAAAIGGFGWLFWTPVWLLYVHRSQRVRVTFEHSVKVAGAQVPSALPAASPSPVVEAASSPVQVVAAAAPTVAVEAGRKDSSGRTFLVAVVAVAGLVGASVWWEQHDWSKGKVASGERPAPLKYTAAEREILFAEPVHEPRLEGREFLQRLRKSAQASAASSTVQEVAERLRDAQAGDGAAQYTVSEFYDEGRIGGRRDGKQALHWLWRAASGDNSLGLLQLSLRLATGGHGVAVNHRAARAWTERLLQRENFWLMVPVLVEYYRDGSGGPQDYAAALAWARYGVGTHTLSSCSVSCCKRDEAHQRTLSRPTSGSICRLAAAMKGQSQRAKRSSEP